MPKPITILILIIISLLSLSQTAYAVTEFNCIIDPDSGAGFDYASLSAWEDALAPGTTDLDLTSAATQVFSWDAHGTSGVPADGASVWKSIDNGVTATCVHTTGTDNGQILLKDIAGGTFADNDIVQYQTDTNYSVTLSSAGDSAIALATCRTIGGTADITAVTIDGWVTSATNYIKVWTDPSESYRHSGVWDEGKYRLEIPNSHAHVLIILEEYVRIEGLQILKTNITCVDGNGIHIHGSANGEIRINFNIIRAIESDPTRSHGGISYWKSTSGAQVVKIWNNIIYDFKNSSGDGYGIYNYNTVTQYWYNNTVVNCGIGYWENYGTIYAKNNIAQSCNNGYNDQVGFDSSSDFNISDTSQADADDVNATFDGYKTVSFVDSDNDDFHLASTDTSAKDVGTDLSSDPNLAITDDIDGDTRGGSWDIGADEAVNNIYRSVGPSATTALATGAGNDLTIDGTTLVFASALANTIGVGDVLQYDVNDSGADIDASDALAFIHSRTSPTRYTARSADGSAPTTIAAYDQDWSIFRAYTSLANAENGIENTGIDEDLRNFDNWTAGGDAAASDLGKDISATGSNELWNIACYANGTTADSTVVTIDDWTTGANNYIKVYTPTATTEVGTTQRHSGTLDTNKYVLERSAYYGIFTINENYTQLEGLQLKDTSVAGGDGFIEGTGTNLLIDRCIMKRTGTAGAGTAIRSAGGTVRNTIIYGSKFEHGIYDQWEDRDWNVYNCVFSGMTLHGISHYGAGTFVVKNTAVFDITGTDFVGAETIAYCASDDGDGTNAVDWDNEATDWANVFEDYANGDFHLKNYSGAGAIMDQGTDLTAEGYTDDIDGDTRPWIGSSDWDIGADEYSFPGLVLEGVVLEGVVVE